MKTCRRHGPACQSMACDMHKPHLRLHYSPVEPYPWSIKLVDHPLMHKRYGFPTAVTNQHWDAAGALRAARVFWWPSL